MEELQRRVLSVLSISLILLLGLFMPNPVRAYEEIAVKDGGTIFGRVQFSGAVPEPEVITINKDKEVCAKEPKYTETLVVSKSKGVKNAIISIRGITRGKQWDQATVEFIQRRCQYTPHVLIVPEGGTVNIINDDPLTHNVHTFAFDNPTINHGQPKTVRTISAKVEVPETIRVACDVHPWMKAWWRVTDHPYYAVTDAEGNFKLTWIPPGTYQLQVWHESLGKETKEVTVKENEIINVSLELKEKKKKRIEIK